MSSREHYLGRVQAIVWQSAEFVSAGALSEVQRLVDHGEPAEGLCSLAWAMEREDARVPLSIIKAIQELTGGIVGEEFMPPKLTDRAIENRGG